MELLALGPDLITGAKLGSRAADSSVSVGLSLSSLSLAPSQMRNNINKSLANTLYLLKR